MTTASAKVATVAPRQPRMTLGSIVRNANTGPMRILLHGLEKVGKTTFAAGAPAPVFICPEDGIPAALGEMPHFPTPDGGWSWGDVIDAVRSLAQGGHGFKTLVIDTVDWVEPLVWRDVCDKARVATIEEVGGGFGKGYVAAVDNWRVLLAELERVRKAAGMHVIFLAHSWIKSFKDPESEGWDRYELKVNNKAAGLVKEWVDAILFGKFEEFANKDARTKRVRGISSGERVIFTVRSAAYDAGNRYNLPDRLPLDWDAFAEAVKAGRPADPAQLLASIEEYLKTADEKTVAAVRASLEKVGQNAAELARINNKLAAMAGHQEQANG